MRKHIFTIIVLLLTTQIYSQTKSLKVLLDDGTERYYPVGEVTKLTFEDDACDGVTEVVYENKTYSTFQIGSQCWFKENLNVGKLNPAAVPQTQANTTIEKYGYNDDELYCNTFGGFYRWDEAMNYSYSSPYQGICPSGWHIPTLSEMETLESYVGGASSKLVDESQTTSGYIANNNTGFSALFAGRPSNGGGVFSLLGYCTYYWSSTESGFSSSDANYMFLQYDFEYVGFPQNDKTDSFNVRCLKN